MVKRIESIAAGMRVGRKVIIGLTAVNVLGKRGGGGNGVHPSVTRDALSSPAAL